MLNEMFPFKDHISSKLTRKSNIQNALLLRGRFKIELLRNGQKIHEQIVDNTIVNVGKNKALDILFGDDSKISNWYISLIQDGSYSAIAAADTMASHAGWAEFTGYDESSRPEWNPDAAASQSISNGTARSFNINTGDTLKGIFITSDSVKAGISGTLWAATLFASDITVANGDELKITYTVNT